MYKIERLLVGLDQSKMDEVLIKYTSHLAKAFDTEKVYFFHSAKSFELPEELKHTMAPTDESLKSSFEQAVKANWESGYDCEKEIEIKEGNPTDQLLKWVNLKSVDMLVMGRKSDLKGVGVMPQKIAKIAQNSVMLVPENASFKLDKVVVPIDFSKHSSLAVEEAVNLSEKRNIEIIGLNVFTVPVGYHKSGKSYEEFASIMKKHAENDFSKFAKTNKLEDKMHCNYVLDDDSAPADKIYGFATEKNADMIIMGSRGRTGIASILLGSVAEKVINFDAEIPLMIVKEKGENMGFLKALLNM